MKQILGVLWNPESDQLIFDVANLALDRCPTKRTLVSLIGKFYDPLRFLSPGIIRFDMLLQKLCQCKSDWDEIIPDELVEEWKWLISDLNVTLTVYVPRSYLSGITDTLTLCGFCDVHCSDLHPQEPSWTYSLKIKACGDVVVDYRMLNYPTQPSS